MRNPEAQVREEVWSVLYPFVNWAYQDEAVDAVLKLINNKLAGD